MAVSFTVSYTFSPGATISSSQVNTNFSDEANVWSGLEAKTTTLSNLGIDTELKSGGTIKAANGTVTAPSVTFTNSTGTGLYRIGADNLGIATAGVIAMSISSAQAVNIKGTATNDAAAASYVGEYISSVAGATNYPSNGTFGDLTSISLTAGDWDVSATVASILNAATATSVIMGISSTSGNSSTGLVSGDNQANNLPPVAASLTYHCIPSYRMSLASTTTVYLKFYSDYSAGQIKANGGRLSARRVR